MRVSLQPAYILHGRPYRDSSLILEAFTAEHGRISLVAKGARRRARGGSTSALLQPFTPLLLSFSGRSELKTLTQVEPAGLAQALRGQNLYSALYVNELLMRLLHKHDPHPRLFADYTLVVEELAAQADVEVVLRRFELGLLDQLGYSFSLCHDGHSGESLDPEAWYQFHPDHGMVVSTGDNRTVQPAYRGDELLAMSRGEFAGESRLAARRLMRQVLAVHLGDAPLRSRELFRARTRGKGE